MSTSKAKLKCDQIGAYLSPFGWKIIYDWSFSLGALIAYNLIISLLPLILCLFSVCMLIFGDDTELQGAIRDRLVKSFPGDVLANVLDTLLDSLSKQAGFIFLISFLIAIFAGSRLFICIDDVLTIIYRIPERTILEQNLHAIKMLLAFIVIMPFILISSFIPALLKNKETLYHFFATMFSGILAFVLFCFIYYCVPDRKMSCRNIWCGSLFVTVALQILLSLFPIYVHNFMNNYVGQLGFIVIALLLFYLFGLLLVIGAQINAYYFEHIQPLSSGLGTSISQIADREHVQLIDGNSQPNNSMSTLIDSFNPHN